MKTYNPYSGNVLETYSELTTAEIQQKLELARRAQAAWKLTTMEERASKLKTVAALLGNNKERYARQMALEMGKPIKQGRSEIEKCVWLCEHFAAHASSMLAPEHIKTDYEQSYVVFEPLGTVLAVMPWNYPFWQVMRFIAPALMAGNVGVLKHASGVMGCAVMLEELFLEAGYNAGCFQNFIISSDAVEDIIKNPIIKAVTLTGSKAAGSAVASTAAAEIKKAVLELGGSNALVVFNDAAIDKTIETCVAARYQNTGQSCIAGKRLLLHKDIAPKFLKKLKDAVLEMKSGNPLDEETYIGVMAREELAKELEVLMEKSIKMGATLELGGKRDKAFFEPTILTNVTANMPVFKEETFGPLLAVTIFETVDEAVELVNQSEFGLGVSLFTEDIELATSLVPRFKDGAV
ncbi:MAG: aldehyde dehydrogenase family protein, partial [Nonlabens sp.]|nr:aldehyde dehydrogenase family protein [Nonlabens sp.]